MTVTLYEKKQNLGTLGSQLKKVNEEIAMKAGDPTVADKDLMQLQEQSESLEKRYNMLKEQVEREEAEQRAKFTKTKTPTMTAEEKLIHAKAEFYRGQKLSSDYKQVLGDDDTTTHGSKLLPVTIANDIIAEPTDTNPLRDDELVTAVTNLERPRIDVTIDDDSFVNDEEVAKEFNGKAEFLKCNVDEERTLALKQGISSIPCIIAFKNGKMVDKSVGLVPKEVFTSFVKKQLN